MSSNHSIPLSIIVYLLAVDRAVNLKHHTGRVAVEVGQETVNNLLAAKVQAR